MSQSAPAPQKVCIRCQQDCSKKARTRDEQGRYTCKACFDAALREPVRAAPSPAAPAANPALGDLDEPSAYSLADDLPDISTTPAAAAGGPCPECGNFLPGATVICVKCGYNRKTGRSASIRTTTEVVDNETWKDKRHKEFAKASRKEYAKAAVVAIIGIGVGIAVVSDKYGAEAFLGFLLVLGIFAASACATYVACGLAWVGFDASLPLSLARIFAVSTIVTSVHMLTMGIPFYFGRMLFLALIYAGTLTRLADIEFEDAVMIGVLTGGVWIIASMTIILSILSGYL